MVDALFVGVDMGTGSVRACITDGVDSVLSVAEKIDLESKTVKIIYSREIWAAVVQTINQSVRQAKDECPTKGKFISLAFSATCLMVVMKQLENGCLVPYPANRYFTLPEDNKVLWIDHRSRKETDKINSLLRGDLTLKYIEGGFLPEMGLPKAKYLMKHIPSSDW